MSGGAPEIDPRVTALLADGEQVTASGPAVSLTFARAGGDDGGGVVALTDQRLLVVYDTPKQGVGDAMSVPFAELRGMDVLTLGDTAGRVLRLSIAAPARMQGRLRGPSGAPADAFAYDLVVTDELADGLVRWFATLRNR
jgi:hypothetical protein